MILGQLRIGARSTTYAALVGGSVGGCGARAVSRKTPIYFIRIWVHFIENSDVISLVIDQPSSKFKGWQ